MPPSGPRRSCDTLRLNPSRLDTSSRSDCVRACTVASSVWFASCSARAAAARRATSASSARRRRSRLTVSSVIPKNSVGITPSTR